MAHLHRYHISSERQGHSHGQIQVIFGPMFSGKTTELMRRIKRYQIANYSCLVVKYAHDTRYDEHNLSTHDNQTLTAVAAVKLAEVEDAAAKYDIVGVDEGQFFPDCVQFAEKMAAAGKIVVVAALDGTYQRKAFGDILQLVPIAENVIKLTAVCNNCYSEASFTKRIGLEKELEVIGGADKYMATCRLCHGPSPRKHKAGNKVSPFKRDVTTDLQAATKKLQL